MPLGIPSAGGDTLFMAGVGTHSIQIKGTRHTGQTVLTNGSASITGVGTVFTAAAPQGLATDMAFFFVDSAGDTFLVLLDAIINDTSATISAIIKNNIAAAIQLPPEFGGVTGTYNTYAGGWSSATGESSFSFGDGAVASGTQSIAWGITAFAGGAYSSALGAGAQATLEGGQALGAFTVSSALGAVTVGYDHTNNVAASVTLGSGAVFVRATAGRWEVLGAGGDVVLASPNGTRYKITVDNSGVISAAPA